MQAFDTEKDLRLASSYDLHQGGLTGFSFSNQQAAVLA